jgi:hypothetical protein
MRYLLSIYGDESQRVAMTAEDGARVMAAYDAFDREARAAGVLVDGAGLQPTPTATTIRVRDGERLITDGPFAETKEQLGGFYLLECKDLDEAIEWAAKIPGAQHGSVEVRPEMDYERARAGASSQVASTQA